MAKDTNKQFLETLLSNLKVQRRELEVKHRIAIALYDEKYNILTSYCDIIEKQLDSQLED